jgi:hypothetical protein
MESLNDQVEKRLQQRQIAAQEMRNTRAKREAERQHVAMLAAQKEQQTIEKGQSIIDSLHIQEMLVQVRDEIWTPPGSPRTAEIEIKSYRIGKVVLGSEFDRKRIGEEGSTVSTTISLIYNYRTAVEHKYEDGRGIGNQMTMSPAYMVTVATGIVVPRNGTGS